MQLIQCLLYSQKSIQYVMEHALPNHRRFGPKSHLPYGGTFHKEWSGWGIEWSQAAPAHSCSWLSYRQLGSCAACCRSRHADTQRRVCLEWLEASHSGHASSATHLITPIETFGCFASPKINRENPHKITFFDKTGRR